MRLLFKQRLFSWFDSYDIYDEAGNTLYTVKGQLSWGHLLKIFDSAGNEVGKVKERIFTFLPKFELYSGDVYLGCLSRKLSFFRPQYNIDFNSWQVSGDYMGWDYTVRDDSGKLIAIVSKQIFNFTDTYIIDVTENRNALYALMLVLAIDAEKCSKS